MIECNNCLSNDICSLDKRPKENCFFFSETEESRIKNSNEYRLGYEQGKADERAKAIEECKDVVFQHWRNGTVAYRIADKIYGDMEQLKEQK